jgi:heavy metal sensor kinase
MIGGLPIRVRLTLWYFTVLALSLLFISYAALSVMRGNIEDAVDDEMRGRIQVIRDLMEQQETPLFGEELANGIKDYSSTRQMDLFLQIADAQGNWIYRSRQMIAYGVSLPQDTHKGVISVTASYNHSPFRVRTELVPIRGQWYSIQMAAPIQEFEEALEKYRQFLFVALPFILLLATLGGYFMSWRALAPVGKIIEDARAFEVHSLSSRLAVPSTGDELQRLSETLNSMLMRIEGAFRKVTQFTADASHELRTPLAIMRTRAELTLRRPRPEAEYRDALEQVLTELERTSELVEKLMLLARADSGAPVLHLVPVDLGEILRDTSMQAHLLATEKQIEFSGEIPAKPIWIEGDTPSLRRLFLILVDNAVKYTPSGGAIELACMAAEGWATITVHDNGIGIPADDLPNIFERFYRADKARSRESGGAGLGLAIGRWIAHAHAGTIEAESASGKGSTFRVRLPLTVREGKVQGQQMPERGASVTQ